MPSSINILGIRHHGPGSARSLLRALDELHPDCVLIEGPPDADAILPHAASKDMLPPVAILVHDADAPLRAVYYPFAEFSPEWQAIRYALAHNIPVRFMDLPQSHRLAIETDRLAKLAQTLANQPPTDADSPAPTAPVVDRDPLSQLARAAGFDDGERWWEHVVEHRAGSGLALFSTIRDAMAELRANQPAPRDDDEPLREAWMRRTIREAQKEFSNIAVVCGAWHVPALDLEATPRKQDDDTLRNLPKIKTSATWVPWTHDRLTYFSGYGAGVQSPGWYEHLWLRRDADVIESWMTRVAHLLRAKDLDCSSAHVIEAVRLSTTLATLRGRPLADLSDIADATRSVFCFDSDLPMHLIARDLLVGNKLGELPDDVPAVPLQQDLTRLQKSLRLKPEASERDLELDLRNDTDRARSHLLHRLRLLGIDWGTPPAPSHTAGGKGTFKEPWKLRWEPEFAVRLIESAVLGTTVEQAATAKLRQLAATITDLRDLSSRLQDAMLAELPDAAAALVKQIETIAAVAADVSLLMQTLPKLATLLRYGNVRQTDATLVREIVDGLIPRITAGLSPAVASLNDDAAAEMDANLRATHDAVHLLENPSHTADWHAALQKVVASTTIHGLIRGRSARLLFDSNQLPPDAVAQHLSLTLSPGNAPETAARWLEGFLSGSGLLLLHDPRLLSLIDAWVTTIHPDIFQQLLPLLRRTFSTFPAPERRQLGVNLSRGVTAPTSAAAAAHSDIDPVRASKALPLLRLILITGTRISTNEGTNGHE